ncbi:MAG: DUF3604 domain-containing protein [Xanthomonadales bacterium]|jgi:hypothetical protein|nr:DUF3604 domain-containing protein [Xanthomonadales bacterium]
MTQNLLILVALMLLLPGCDKAPEPAAAPQSAAVEKAAVEVIEVEPPPPPVSFAPHRTALFGAVHVHTRNSFDAFTNGTVTTPADAYQWAKGQAIQGNRDGFMMQLKKPLDFYAVSDHAEMMGVFPLMADPDHPLNQHPMAGRVLSDDQNTAMQAFAEILVDFSTGNLDPAFTDSEISRSVWSEIVKTADAYYEPGSFTTFAAFEWSSNPEMRNLHRVVVFENTDKLPELAFSALDSQRPEDLWAWMAIQREAGAELLAIPHNGNASDGLMFATTDSDGKPMDAAYIAERTKNEPVYEISQIKGTSETHPALSPNDEFASFEIWDYTLSAEALRPTHRQGSYARQALLDGLSMAGAGSGNPFQFGFIGDSDTHNAAASHEEFNITGKFAFESEAQHRLLGVEGQPPGQAQQVREFSSGGLAGVWAEQNTRESIYQAIARRETFATSGPHIQLRMFAGWGFDSGDELKGDWVARAYEIGVPMGSELNGGPGDSAPSFIVWAMKDPDSGNLDRIQMVKGWVGADGAQQERIYDIAWSDMRVVDPRSGKLPDVGNTVDLATATYVNSIGDARLRTVWVDPDFDPSLRAFYYPRVLEIPTPRWSTRDAVSLGVEIPAGLPATIQERAWGSPIWYTPGVK